MGKALSYYKSRYRKPAAELQRLLGKIDVDGWPIVPQELANYLKHSHDLRALEPLIALWHEKPRPPKPARRMLRSQIRVLLRANQWLLGIHERTVCKACGIPAVRARFSTFWLQWHWKHCPHCHDHNDLCWPVHATVGVIGTAIPRSEDGVLHIRLWDAGQGRVAYPLAQLDRIVVQNDVGQGLPLACAAVLNHWAEERGTLPPIYLQPGVTLPTHAQRLLEDHGALLHPA